MKKQFRRVCEPEAYDKKGENVMKKKIMNLTKTMSLLVCLFMMAALFLTGCGSAASKTQNTASIVEETTGAPAGDSAAATDMGTEGESALLTKIKEKGVLTVASSNDAPFAYIDVETGGFEGIDAVIIKEIASRLGIEKVEMKEIAFENLLIELNNGSVDMVTDAMYIKDERLEQTYFTNVWYQEGEGIIIPEDSAISTKDDLVDVTLGAQKGTAFLETAEEWASAGKVKEVSIYAKQTELMLAVDGGKVDACITDGIVAAYTLAQDTSLKLKLLSPYEAEATGRIGAAIRFEDKDFLDEVNAVLDEMKEDGSLMKILEDFGLTEDYFVGVEEGYTENIK